MLNTNNKPPNNLSAFHLESLGDIKDLKNYIPVFEKIENNFYKFAQHLAFPITIIFEEEYVDRIFRDTFYNYFSSKHDVVNRNCHRMSIFMNKYIIDDFYDSEKKSEIQLNFIGVIILKPLDRGVWGKTLVDPNKMSKIPSYIRTTKVDLIINGVNLSIEAYPFSSQDTEFMTCAETSVWTVLYYYGLRYPEYRTVLPSEITNIINQYTSERTLPSRGLSFYQQSNILKTFGFYPRIYSTEKYGEKEAKRNFHYYVESGIPIIMSLNGHAVVCIGHAIQSIKLSNIKPDIINNIKYVDTADLYDEYVIMDDNQYPYTIQKYDDFSLHKDCKKLKHFTVPLYKRIFLESINTKTIFDIIISRLFHLKPIVDVIGGLTNDNNECVLKRIFLTSSRKFKMFRIQTSNNNEECSLYSNLLFPKFIWVMELSSEVEYENHKVFGEIVLDATSNGNINSVLLLRISNYFGFKTSSEKFNDVLKRIIVSHNINTEFKQYDNNLNFGGNYDKQN